MTKSGNTKGPIIAPPIERLSYKASDAAAALGISRQAVYQLVRNGRLQYTRLAGGSILISRASIDAYLASSASEAVAG